VLPCLHWSARSTDSATRRSCRAKFQQCIVYYPEWVDGQGSSQTRKGAARGGRHHIAGFCSEHPTSTSSSTCHPTSREALSTGQYKTATRRILLKGCWIGTDIVVVPFVGSATPHRPWMLLTSWLHILAHQRSDTPTNTTHARL
jgi:hypothetical protein